jgi:hypothetical protein
MKRSLLLTFCFLPFLLAVGYATKVYAGKFWQASEASLPATPAVQSPPVAVSSSRIQVALLLDVSSSMDGLIDQAQAQLWDMVNQLGEARRDGSQPQIELSLYIYGGSFLSVEQGFVQQLLPLTNDLDAVSEQLFAQTTNGGDEYCGWVIRDAVRDLAWTDNDADLRMIFIAGNESFSQGAVLYQQACRQAQEAGILINTIFCGPYQMGVDLQWQMGATAGGGQYLHIDQNQAIEQIATPYDTTILRLNQQMNATYLSYGQQGAALKERQVAQDQQMAAKYGSGGLSKRAMAKCKTGLYQNQHWDLVDASAESDFDWEAVDQQTLAPELRGLTPEQLKAHVEGQAEMRQRAQQDLVKLEVKRKAYVAEKRQEHSQTEPNTLDQVIRKTVCEQAKQKKFTFQDQP